MRFLPLCSTNGNSNGHRRDTKGGFLFVPIVEWQGNGKNRNEKENENEL